MNNLTCEVGGSEIRMFEGNYDYYEWKKQSEKSIESNKPKVKNESKGKSEFKERKRTRNRLAWIEKRFKSIELELEDQRSISQDLADGDDYEFLQKTMETMSELENEYPRLTVTTLGGNMTRHIPIHLLNLQTYLKNLIKTC